VTIEELPVKRTENNAIPAGQKMKCRRRKFHSGSTFA
jgi:hypothetical protein